MKKILIKSYVTDKSRQGFNLYMVINKNSCYLCKKDCNTKEVFVGFLLIYFNKS